MTLKERVIVTAYTGYTMLQGTEMNELYKYAEEITGIKPVYTHMFADKGFVELLQEKSKADFIRICSREVE
jgi:hypothetical protein